jgi:hypothetical protein
VEEFLLLKLQKQAAARAQEAAAQEAAAAQGDSGIDTGSDVTAESRGQSGGAREREAGGENGGDRKKRVSVDLKHNDVGPKTETKERMRKTSEMSVKSSDDVFEEDIKRAPTVEAKKASAMKKRKRSTVSQPENH